MLTSTFVFLFLGNLDSTLRQRFTPHFSVGDSEDWVEVGLNSTKSSRNLGLDKSVQTTLSMNISDGSCNKYIQTDIESGRSEIPKTLNDKPVQTEELIEADDTEAIQRPLDDCIAIYKQKVFLFFGHYCYFPHFVTTLNIMFPFCKIKLG